MAANVWDFLVKKYLSKYHHKDKTQKDVRMVFESFGALKPKEDSYTFSDGICRELLCIEGTIPVCYKGSTYNIPICIWLMDTHPDNAPLCFVKPTPDMLIKPSKYVDDKGRIYLPYLHDWKYPQSELIGLIKVMTTVFSEVSPLFKKPLLLSPQGLPPPPPCQVPTTSQQQSSRTLSTSSPDQAQGERGDGGGGGGAQGERGGGGGSHVQRALNDALDEEIELNDMVFHEQLGEGAFGTVNRVTFTKPFKGYTEAAAKSIQSLRKEEINIMRELCHPNIVTLLAFYQKGPINMIIIELAKNKSLHDFLADKLLPQHPTLKCRWMREAAYAIDYLHVRNFLHRDIKSSNCLLFTNYVLKLCDFGLARSIHHSQSSSSVKGTFRYMAPEIIKGNEQGRGLYSKPGDVYAYGMLLLEIETRKQPFDGIEWQTVIFKVGNGEQPTIPDTCPQSLSTLMKQCWSMDPKQRPTTNDIITELVQVESGFAFV